PTADCRVLDGGTAYQTDAGMCGDYNSVIGMDKQAATGRFTGDSGGRLSVASGAPSLCGVLVDVELATGLAKQARSFRRGGALENTSAV
ncbi:MAG: YmdB family metallophosphoesterase, partial [Candidatus Puniceispirillaceae bacterium]